MLAVAQDDISDIADTQSVDQDIADLDLLADSCAVFRELEHIARTENENILFLVSKRAGDFGLCLEVAEFTVDRDGVSGLDQVIDQLDVLLTGVSGCVHILADNISTLQQEFIDHGGDCLLVARDGAGGKDNRIVGADGHFAVHAVRHAAEGCHALALAAGGDDHGLLSRIIPELINVDQGIVRHVQNVEIGRGLDDIDHAAAFDDDLSAVFIGVIDDLLHAVHVGGKGCDDNACVCVIAENLIDVPADGLLGRSVAGVLRIGGVAHKGKYAFIAQLSKTLQVDRIAIDRCEIDLEITGVYNGACRRFDGQRSSIYDAVIGLDKFNVKLSQLDNIPERNDMALRNLEKIMLAQLVFDDAHCQPCSVNGNIDLFQNIGQGADVVFVTVGNNKALYLVNILLQISCIRNDKIDTEHVVLREGKAAVHNHNTVPELERGNVHADLFKPAERNNTHGRSGLSVHFFMVFFQSVSSSEDLFPPARRCIPACRCLCSFIPVILFCGFS